MLQKVNLSRRRRDNHELGVYSLILIGLGIGASLVSVAAYIPSISLPGRPVVGVSFGSIAHTAAGFVAALGALSALIASRINRYIGFLAVILYLLALNGYWWAPLIASLLVLLVVEDVLLVVAGSSLFAAIFLVLRPLGNEIAELGAAALLGGTLIGLVLGVISAIFVLLGGESVRYLARPREIGDKAGWALVMASFALAVLMVLIPHLRYGFNEIISYDTYFNLRFCELLRRGNYEGVFLQWQRPLYVLAVTGPATLTGCKPWFFDIVVPVAGLVLLVAAVWSLVKKWLGSTLLAGFASLLSLAYWTPFFLYAGLQTNLLALPAALYLIYITFEGKSDWRVLASLSLFLGLWHPWSLAFYTIAMLVSLLIPKASRSRVLLKRIVLAASSGWIAHSIIAILSKISAVASVVKWSSSSTMPLLWSIEKYYWGTIMRPDMLLTASVGIIISYISARSSVPRWLAGLVALSFLAVIGVPNTLLLVRFLIDTPLPLLLVYLASKGRHPKASLTIIAAASLLMLVYFLESLKPVILFPH